MERTRFQPVFAIMASVPRLLSRRAGHFAIQHRGLILRADQCAHSGLVPNELSRQLPPVVWGAAGAAVVNQVMDRVAEKVIYTYML